MTEETRAPRGPISESEEIVSLGQRITVWAARNASMLTYAGGAVLFIALIGIGFWWVQNNRQAAANAALTDAVNLMQPLAQREGEPDAAPGPERLREAVEAFREVSRDYPGMPQGKSAAIYAADALFALGSYQQASRALEDLRRTDPAFLQRYNGAYLLGKSYEAAGDYSKAIALFGEVSARATGDMKGQVLLDMARCSSLSGDRDRAAELLAQVRADFPAEGPIAQRAEKMLILLGSRAAAR